jgi:hypothetical protein
MRMKKCSGYWIIDSRFFLFKVKKVLISEFSRKNENISLYFMKKVCYN